jgi:hypothetical protein
MRFGGPGHPPRTRTPFSRSHQQEADLGIIERRERRLREQLREGHVSVCAELRHAGTDNASLCHST